MPQSRSGTRGVTVERFSALPAAAADEAAAATADEAAAPTADEAAAATADDHLARLSHKQQSIAESISAAINFKVNSDETVT
jgi:hypothetical protein